MADNKTHVEAIRGMITDIRGRIDEHDGRLAEDEDQYVAGLKDALRYVKARAAVVIPGFLDSQNNEAAVRPKI